MCIARPGLPRPLRPEWQITLARGRSSSAPKNACVFRGRSNLVEPAWSSAPQGAARAGETRGATEGSDAAPTLLLCDVARALVKAAGIYIKNMKKLRCELVEMRRFLPRPTVRSWKRARRSGIFANNKRYKCHLLYEYKDICIYIFHRYQKDL